MSGYNNFDKFLEDDGYSDLPALNVITGPGNLPSDKVPTGSKQFNH